MVSTEAIHTEAIHMAYTFLTVVLVIAGIIFGYIKGLSERKNSRIFSEREKEVDWARYFKLVKQKEEENDNLERKGMFQRVREEYKGGTKTNSS